MTDEMTMAREAASIPHAGSCGTMMPRGIKRVVFHKGGRAYSYYYHRATGKPLTASFGTPEFLAQVERLDAQARRLCHAHATLATLVAAYRASDEWKIMAAHSQKTFDTAFLWLETLEGTPLARMGMRTPYRLRDRAARDRGDHFAAGVQSALRVLLAWGKPRGYIMALESGKGGGAQKDTPGLRA